MAGPEQQDSSPLRTLAQELGVADRIVWTGMLNGDLKWGALRAAEVFALPSHQENFGIAVVEALACGTPVLILREVNIWREIVESRAGFAEADTLEGTVNLLRSWFDLTGDQRDAMRSAAVNCFRQRFEINRATEVLLSVLREFQQPSPAANESQALHARSLALQNGGFR